MRFSLLPKENIFYDLIEELSRNAERASHLFSELIQNWRHDHPNIEQLKNLEHECDEIVHKIMIKLNKTFVTPIDREDIHLLTKKLDDIVDVIQALSERMVLFQVMSVKDNLKEMSEILEKAMGIMNVALSKIRHLKDSEKLLDLCIEIHSLENQGDRLFENAIGKLFMDGESPIEVIKWKEIYDYVERAIDLTEDISDIIWGIVVKYG